MIPHTIIISHSHREICLCQEWPCMPIYVSMQRWYNCVAPAFSDVLIIIIIVPSSSHWESCTVCNNNKVNERERKEAEAIAIISITSSSVACSGLMKCPRSTWWCLVHGYNPILQIYANLSVKTLANPPPPRDQPSQVRCFSNLTSTSSLTCPGLRLPT